MLHVKQSFHEYGGESFDELIRASFQDILGAGGGMAVDATVRLINRAYRRGFVLPQLSRQQIWLS